MSEILSPRKVASRWSRADLRTELPSGNPETAGQPYFEPTTGRLEVSRGQHKQINMEAMQSLPAGLLSGYHAEHTARINFQLPASDAVDGTPTDIGNEVVHPSIVAFDRKWNGYKYWMVITTYPGSNGAKENPSIVATNDDSFATWEQPARIRNPIVTFEAGLNSQADVSMIYDYSRDKLVIYYLSTYTGGRQFRSTESSDGVNWSEKVIRLTHTGIETFGSPCIVTWDDNGTQRTRVVYYRDFRLCYREATDIYGIGGSWDSVTEVVIPCAIPRDRMLWDFQVYRLASGEWLLCQTLANTAITTTENYWGTSTDDLATVQFDPAPKLGPTTASGDAWADQLIYTTALVARIVDGLLVFDAVATGRGGASVWGGMAVRFQKQADMAAKPLLATSAPAMGTPKTGSITAAKYSIASIAGLNTWTKTNAVTNSADGFVFSAAQNGWLKNNVAGTVGITDWTAHVRFRIDKDPAAATAGARIGVCNVGGIHLAVIRHASGAAWQLEIVTFVGTTPTSRLLAETLPGSYGEWINVAITKSGDALIYASDTDNVLLAGTVSFSHTMTDLCEIGQPAPSVIGDLTISDFRLWNSSVTNAVLQRLARPNGLNTIAKNLLLNSEEIDNATWSKYRVNITANAADNPYARMTADKIIPTAVGGTHAVDTPHTFRRGVPYAWSVNAKADGYGYIALLIGGAGRYFNLTNGTILGSYFAPPYDSMVESLGGGWYRCTVILVPSMGGAGTAGAYVSADGVTTSFTGNGTSGVLIGGCQLAQNEAAPITYHRRLGA